MLSIFSRSLLLISMLITGTLFPLNRAPAQDAPPVPDATQAAEVDTVIYLPMLLRRPYERIATATPRPSATPGGPTSTPAPSSTPGGPTPTLPPVGNAIVVDHTSLPLFDQIPEQYLTAARNLRMMFSDRSVGANINDGLSCLAADSWGAARAYCRVDYIPGTTTYKTYTTADLANGTVPALIQFPANSTTYNRSNWDFEFKQGTWSWLTQNFITELAPSYLSSRDVLSYQFSYVNFGERLSIIDPSQGFFVSTSLYSDITDLEAFFAQHPDKTFFLWTTSLARSTGTLESAQFNYAMRRYAIEHEKILFDAADLLSHDRNGQPCYDNLADGVNYPAICTDYTTELNGGHLGSVSGGMITMAKAYWVLMARIAGWNP